MRKWWGKWVQMVCSSRESGRLTILSSVSTNWYQPIVEARAIVAISNRDLLDNVHAALSIIGVDTCLPTPKEKELSNLQRLVDNMYGANKPTHVVDDLMVERRGEAMRE